MKYTIYKIVNKVNNKEYIGKHITNNIDDDYMGSGKLLKASIVKYGISNFTKETLFIFDNEDQMNRKEAELVTEEYCARKDTYNICPGGQGGWGYVNKTIMEGEKRLEHNRKYTKFGDKEWRRQHVDPVKAGLASAPKTSERMRQLHENGTAPFTRGSKHSEESILRMKEGHKDKHNGERNSQYGTCWITNGTESKKISKLESIPEGWYRGRKIGVRVQPGMLAPT